MLFDRYGTNLSSQSTSPKIRWLRKHEPEVWRADPPAAQRHGLHRLQLTGEATLDIYDAGAYAPLFDVRTPRLEPGPGGAASRPRISCRA